MLSAGSCSSSARRLAGPASVQCRHWGRRAVLWRASNSSGCCCSVLQQQQHQPATAAAPLPRRRRGVFVFKHFELDHSACAMRMGTDAMLLGAWAQPPPHAATLLDVGTGSGVLALMMAQRTAGRPGGCSAVPARITAIDVDADAVACAAANAAASPWADRLTVHQASLQDWTAAAQAAEPAGGNDVGMRRYDMIISNPPFFQHSSKPGASARAAARHADVALPLEQLAACAAQLLAPGGVLALVLPPPGAACFEVAAASAGLLLVRCAHVFAKDSDESPKRHLLEFRHAAAAAADAAASNAGAAAGAAALTPAVERLVVMTRVPVAGSGQVLHVHSHQYRQLTADFHHPAFCEPGSGSSSGTAATGTAAATGGG